MNNRIGHDYELITDDETSKLTWLWLNYESTWHSNWLWIERRSIITITIIIISLVFCRVCSIIELLRQTYDIWLCLSVSCSYPNCSQNTTQFSRMLEWISESDCNLPSFIDSHIQLQPSFFYRFTHSRAYKSCIY